MKQPRKKKDDGRGLAGVLEDYIIRIEDWRAFKDFLSSPDVPEYQKTLIRAAAYPPVSFEKAVSLIASAPLIAEMKALGPSFMVEAGEDPMLVMERTTILELYSLFHPDTRETADMSRLITAAGTSADDYDAAMELFRQDIGRPGMPNWSLREWASGNPQRPPTPKGKRTTAKLRWRNVALRQLLEDAAVLGFAASRNEATKPSKRSGSEVVQEALQTAGLSPPSLATMAKLAPKDHQT